MPHMKSAFDRLDSLTVTTFRHLKPKSLLYVGWRHDCHPWWHQTFCAELGIIDVGILEIFPANVSDAEQKIWSGYFKGVAVELQQGDVRSADWMFLPNDYDIIFWDHGPEHVSLEDLKVVTPKLFGLAGKMLLYSCPWGSWPQGADDGNEHERHLWDVTPDVFEQMGMLTSTVGSPGQENGGEIIAWRCK